MARYGYARVSMTSQCLDLQIDALKEAKCERIFSEKISTRKKVLPKLQQMLSHLTKGDTVICYKLDRLGRSLLELVNLVSGFESKGVRLISIVDGIDTAKSGSKLLLNIMMCIADFEREMIRERTIAGLEAAKKRGVKLGRPVIVNNDRERKKKRVIALHREGKTPTEIKRLVSISRPTIYKYVQEMEVLSLT